MPAYGSNASLILFGAGFLVGLFSFMLGYAQRDRDLKKMAEEDEEEAVQAFHELLGQQDPRAKRDADKSN